MRPDPKLARFSWALYDFANTIFSVNIIFVYFVIWLTVERGSSAAYYGLALGSSIFLAACLMPIFGEIQDTLKARVPFLTAFTLGCVFFTALLGIVRNIFLALLFFALANLFYQLSAVVYNSLLAQVSRPDDLGKTSGLGASLGYLGAILAVSLVRPFLGGAGKAATFIPSAGLFLLFASPAFIFIKDSPRAHIPRIQLKIEYIFLRLGKTLLYIRRDRSLFSFLISAFLCLNAVNAIIVYMGLYAKRVMNFADTEIIYFLSVSTVFAVVGSWLFGLLSDRRGPKDTLNLVIKLWCLTIFLAGISIKRWMFWLSAPLAGSCLGATWVTLRPMLIELTKGERTGQMFALLGLTGGFSSILGPIVWGVVTNWGFAAPGAFKYRIAILAIFIFMAAGFVVFQGVHDPRKNSRI